MRAEGTPNSTASVGLVAIDDELLQYVRQALSAEAVLPESSVSFGEGVDHLMRTMPNVALVGIDRNSDGAVKFAKEIRAENPSITLIAVARSKDSDVILTAMRVGFEEFVVLPDDGETLRAAVSKAAVSRNDDVGTAMVVTLVGAKGGVGTTLLAAHLAAELAGIHRVLCVDLNFGKGDLAAIMDVTAKETIGDLLSRAANVDERMLLAHTIVHGSKVHLLCQPDDLDRIESVNPDDLFNVINAAAQGYQYVIIDAGSAVRDDTDVAIRVADHVLLVTTPDVVSVRDAHRTLRSMLARNVDRSNIRIVVNKMPRQPYLTAEQIETNLGVKVVAMVPDDPKRVDQAVNEGKLLRELHPRAEVIVEIGKLVGLLSDDVVGPESAASAKPSKGGGILSRFFSS